MHESHWRFSAYLSSGLVYLLDIHLNLFNLLDYMKIKKSSPTLCFRLCAKPFWSSTLTKNKVQEYLLTHHFPPGGGGGQIKTRKLYLSVIPFPKFCRNITNASLLLFTFSPVQNVRHH